LVKNDRYIGFFDGSTKPRPARTWETVKKGLLPATVPDCRRRKNQKRIRLLTKAFCRHREAARQPWRSRNALISAGFWIAASAFGLLAMTSNGFVSSLRMRRM
jgi:hypothetical protein